MRSAEGYGPDDDEDVEEDEGDCWGVFLSVSVWPFGPVWSTRDSLLGWVLSLTPHQRPHGVDQIDRFGFHAGAVLRTAAEGGLVLRCVAPADCGALLVVLVLGV